MGTLKVDLDVLERLGATLHGLATEAGALRTGPAAGPYASPPGGIMSSVSEAASISSELVDASLVPAIKERLGETGDVMIHVPPEFSRDYPWAFEGSQLKDWDQLQSQIANNQRPSKDAFETMFNRLGDPNDGNGPRLRNSYEDVVRNDG